MKLFIFAVIGIIVILHILDQKPPTPTENGKKIETIRETANGITKEKTIISDMNHVSRQPFNMPINLENLLFRNN